MMLYIMLNCSLGLCLVGFQLTPKVRRAEHEVSVCLASRLVACRIRVVILYAETCRMCGARFDRL